MDGSIPQLSGHRRNVTVAPQTDVREGAHTEGRCDLAGSVALARRFFVARMEPIVDNYGHKQHHAANNILRFAVNVHDRESVKQSADQRAADDDAQYPAPSADEANAAEHHHQDHVEDFGTDNDDVRLHAVRATRILPPARIPSRSEGEAQCPTAAPPPDCHPGRI